MTTDSLLRECDARGVLRLTLNRPERRNALYRPLIDALTDAFTEVAGDPSVRAVILAGAGPVFCAGADFDWLREMSADGRDAACLAALNRSIHDCPRPVVARVQGGAYAGGIGMIAACDVMVAAEDAKFAITEARLGLTPSLMLPYLLGRIGLRQVRRYCLTGAVFDAAMARALGLVDEVAPLSSLDAVVEDIVDAALQCAPDALSETKALVKELTAPPVTESAVAQTVDAFAEGRAGAEAREGLAARLDNRKASWAVR